MVVRTYNERKLQRQHARMGIESATNTPPNNKPVRVSTRTGMPTSNLTIKDATTQRRADEKGNQTRRTKKIKITLPPTPWSK